MEPEKILLPGSDEAKRNKCTCDRRKNCGGRGAYVDRTGRTMYLVCAECPVHGTDSAWGKEKAQGK